jgi:hypothetical protein
MRTLSEMQYWHLVFPPFDSAARRLPTGEAACSGARVFDDPIFAGGATRGSPIEVEEGDVVYGNGGERVRIVWLRTHRWQDGSQAGPIALVRAKEDFAEVYAVGAYRAATANTTLQAERLGTEVLLSATDDGCVGLAKDATCETSVTLFLPRIGRLGRLATLDTTRRAYATGSEPGIQGPVEYELTASPQYTAEGVRLFEQVKATDSTGHLVHRTELERTFVLRDGVLQAGGDPLWGRVYPGQTRAQ